MQPFIFNICSCILKDFVKVRTIFSSHESLVLIQRLPPSSCLFKRKKKSFHSCAVLKAQKASHRWADYSKKARILKSSRSQSKLHSSPAALWINVSWCHIFPTTAFSKLHPFHFLCSSTYSWQTNHCLSTAPQNICLCWMSLAGFSVSHHLLFMLICISVWFTVLSSKNNYVIEGKEVRL